MRRKVFANVTRESTPAYIHAALLHALTEYDRREAAKALRSKYRNQHNHYALAHYLGALHDAEARIEQGADIRTALLDSFCGSLLNFVLRAIHEPIATREEIADMNRRSLAMLG